MRLCRCRERKQGQVLDRRQHETPATVDAAPKPLRAFEIHYTTAISCVFACSFEFGLQAPTALRHAVTSFCRAAGISVSIRLRSFTIGIHLAPFVDEFLLGYTRRRHQFFLGNAAG